MQTSCFGSKFDIQSGGENEVKITKIKSLLPMSHWCLYARLVKIHILVQEIVCRQGLLIQSLYCGDLENLVKVIKILSNLLTIPMLQYIRIGQNLSFGSRGRCFWSKFDIQIAGVTLKMRSRSPKSNHFFSPSQ